MHATTFLNGESRRPLTAQDVQTNTAITVDIRVVYRRRKLYLMTEWKRKIARDTNHAHILWQIIFKRMTKQSGNFAESN